MTESHQARKRFGQNFLIDTSVIERIIAAINPTAHDHIIEIGPGQGALSQPLLKYVPQLDVIEIDRDLVALLQQKFTADRLAIHSADALTFDFATVANLAPLRIVGNLPYNITTPLLFHLLQFSKLIHDMHFMLQKEVVDRMAAEPGSKVYGRLSVMLQYHCQITALFDVPARAFNPAPKVTSAMVRCQPWPTKPMVAHDETLFAALVKTAFSQRRKTLRNNLKAMLSLDQITELPIDPGLRPEQISVSQYIAISNHLCDNRT